MNQRDHFYEPHFEWIEDSTDEHGLVTLGPLTSANFLNDPKSLLFRAARYKFVAKMFEGFNHVLEVGCGDASMSPIVKQNVNSLTAIDIDQKILDYAIKYSNKKFNITFDCFDITKTEKILAFDGIFCLDVLEHIPIQFEDSFLVSCIKFLEKNGVLIIGSPSISSQQFTTEANKLGHVNCKSEKQMSVFLKKYFANVFSFGMNDELIHTGFPEFRNYLFMVCANPRF